MPIKQRVNYRMFVYLSKRSHMKNILSLLFLFSFSTTLSAQDFSAYEKKQFIKGTVVVSFKVDTIGVVSELNIDKSVEWSVDMETLRVFKRSPKWEPATQNGKIVSYYHRHSITHVIN